jgi:hypothetical protein
MKVFYAEISYRTMGWLNLGDDIWALYPQVWLTHPPSVATTSMFLVVSDAGCDVLELEQSYEVLMSLLW